jgi:hypothetical protein
MNAKPTTLDLVIAAMLKLDYQNGERENVIAFIQSCYNCRVCDYDFDAAQNALSRLTDDEEHALIAYIARVS